MRGHHKLRVASRGKRLKVVKEQHLQRRMKMRLWLVDQRRRDRWRLGFTAEQSRDAALYGGQQQTDSSLFARAEVVELDMVVALTVDSAEDDPKVIGVAEISSKE